MSIRVRENDALHVPSSGGQGLGDGRRRRAFEHGVPVLQPSAIHLAEPGCSQHLRAYAKGPLRLRMERFPSGLVAVLEIPLQLADRGRVKRRLQFLADNGLIGVVDRSNGRGNTSRSVQLGATLNSAACPWRKLRKPSVHGSVAR